jgi:curved DNA-binding protein CbpA
MAGKTLYDVLELSSNASNESIRAAYERLSAKFDPSRPENTSRPEVKLLSDAVKEAFLTLGNPTTRAQYDKKIALRSQPPVQILEESEPFWTIPKLTALVLIVIIGAGFYFKDKREEKRLAAEKAIAAAKAKEAEETARAEVERARLELVKQQQDRMLDEQQRRERDMALRQFSSQRITNDRSDQQRLQQERLAEQQRQREEAQATRAAALQAARDKAELCRIERQRYGRAISC